jgi:hypothetical protein
MRLPERSWGATSPRFFPPKSQESALVVSHDDPSVRAAYKMST